MSHEITRTDRFGYVGRPAWHGLGRELPEGIPVHDAFRAMGLDWSTELRPLFFPSGMNLEAGPHSNTMLQAGDARAHVRCDLNTVLGIVNKNYRIVDWHMLADIAESFAGAGATLETLGSMRGGKQVWALMKLPDGTHAVGGNGRDQTVKYLLVLNDHTGKGAFRAILTDIRVVCNNTATWALKQAGRGGFWYRHKGDMDANVAEARRILGFAAEQARIIDEENDALARRTISPVEVDAYFALVYEATFGKRPEPKHKQDAGAVGAVGATVLDSILNDNGGAIGVAALDEAIAEYDQRRGAVVNVWQDNYASDPAYGNAWGALNAVTEFHDHQRGRGEITTRRRNLTDARITSNLTGSSADDKAKARNLVLDTLLAK